MTFAIGEPSAGSNVLVRSNVDRLGRCAELLRMGSSACCLAEVVHDGSGERGRLERTRAGATVGEPARQPASTRSSATP